MIHNAQLITPTSLFLANCCKALGVSAFGAATPPCKSLIYNALCSAGCFLARRELYSLETPSDSPSMGRTLSSRTTFYSHTENTNFTDSRRFFRSHADAAEKRRSALAIARACLRDVCIRHRRQHKRSTCKKHV